MWYVKITKESEHKNCSSITTIKFKTLKRAAGNALKLHSFFHAQPQYTITLTNNSSSFNKEEQFRNYAFPMPTKPKPPEVHAYTLSTRCKVYLKDS